MGDSVSFDILFKTSSAEADLKKFATTVDRIIGGVEKKFSKLDTVTTRLVKNMRVLGNNKFTGFNKGLQSANKQMSMLEKKMRKLNSMSGGGGKGGGKGGGGGNRFVSGAMGLMGGVGIYGLMGMIGGIPKAGMEFESKMTDIKGILNITGDAYNKLGSKIKAVGKDSAFTITQMAGAAKYMAMAGMKGDAIGGSLKSVSNLAMVGGMDVDSSADIMTNIMTSMGIDPSKSGQSSAVADVITGVMTKTNVGIQEIGQSMAYVGGIASQTGQSMTDTAVAIGILGDAGIKGSRAGTNMRQMFLKLAAPTAKASKMMEALKVSVYEIGQDGHRKLKPIGDLLDEFNKSGAGITEFKEIFGVRGGAAFSALAAKATKYKNVLKEINENGGGLSDKLAAAKMATTAGKTLVMQTSWDNLSITLMEKVAPAYNYVLDGMTKLFEKLNNNEAFLEKVESAANFLAVSFRKAYEVGKFLFNLVLDNWSSIVLALSTIGLAMTGLALKSTLLSLANPFALWVASATALVVILDQVSKRSTGSEERSDRLDQMGRQGKNLWNLYANTPMDQIGTPAWKKKKDEAIRLLKNADNKEGDAFYRDMAGESGRFSKGDKDGNYPSPYKNDKSTTGKLLEQIRKATKDMIAPKGGDLDKLLTKLAKIESTTKVNLGGLITGTETKEGDNIGTLSSPLTSVANQMSRSVVVTMEALMKVENQYIGTSGGELSTDDIQTQLAEALIHIVRDTELGLSN